MSLVRVVSKGGIKRDGTNLDGNYYADGQWCRWQRQLPRKMGGYRVTQPYLSAVARALYSQARTGFRYFSSGHQYGIDQFTIDNFAVSSSIASPTLPGFVASPLNTWQFDTQFDNTSNKTLLFALAKTDLLDQSVATNYPVYYADVYSPGTAMTAITPGTGSLAVQVSGGMCSLAPYMTIFGNDGYWAWSVAGQPTNFDNVANPALTGATRITSQKLLKGFPLRGGGGNSPAGLYWSIDSLVRASFVGGTTTWQFDQLTTQSSLLSDRCIVENDGIFYWAGVDRFLMYNGVVREIPNAMNINWFFDNINPIHASKAFVMKIPRYGEIWWCYPRGSNTECSHAVIYNYRENTWYDTVLPNLGRSAGLHADNLIGNVMSGTNPISFSSIPLTSVATSSGGVAVYTGTIINGAGNAFAGQRFTVSGFAGANNNGLFTATASTSTTLTLNNAAATAESASASVTQSSLYNLWQHEVGKDEINGSSQISILSSFTTATISAYEQDPPSDATITIGDLIPDFVQTGDMTVTVLKQNNAKAPQYTGTVGTIYASPADTYSQITPLKDTAKIIQLKFQSNVIGGDYQMGQTMLHVDQDGEKDL